MSALEARCCLAMAKVLKPLDAGRATDLGWRGLSPLARGTRGNERGFFAPCGVIVFSPQIDTLGAKNSSSDKHLQERLFHTPRAFGAD